MDILYAIATGTYVWFVNLYPDSKDQPTEVTIVTEEQAKMRKKVRAEQDKAVARCNADYNKWLIERQRAGQ